MKNNKRLLGYFLILLGILLPLSLTGMMAYREISSGTEYKKFKDNRKKFELDQIKEYNKKIGENGKQALLDPFEDSVYMASYNVKGLEKNNVFAYLIIPKLDMKKPISTGSPKDLLSKSSVHVDGSALPIGGTGNRPIIVGDRLCPGDLMFLFLDELSKGDKIYIDSPAGIIAYVVEKKENLEEGDWDKLEADKNKDLITLISRAPIIPPRTEWLAVTAVRDKQPIRSGQADNNTDYSSRDVAFEGLPSAKVKLTKIGIYGLNLAGFAGIIFILIKAYESTKKPNRSKEKKSRF